MGERHQGDRIVGTGANKRTAPQLPIRYVCPKCNEQHVLDAYDGPPTCSYGHPATFMRGVSVVATVDPLADIDALRTTPRVFS